MKTKKIVQVGSALFLLGASLFAYNEYQVYSTKNDPNCQTLKEETKPGKLAEMVATVDACLAKADQILFMSPAKRAELEKLRSQINAARFLAPIADAFSSVDVPSPAPTPLSVPAPPDLPKTTESLSFDNLSPCEQLDSIARSGSPVSSYLVKASEVGSYSQYRMAIYGSCSWHIEQLKKADNILNPPAISVSPALVYSESPHSFSSIGDDSGLAIRAETDQNWVRRHTEQLERAQPKEKTMSEISDWARWENPQNAHKTSRQIRQQRQ